MIKKSANTGKIGKELVHSGAFGSYPIKTPTRAPFKLFFVQLYINYVPRVLLLRLIFFNELNACDLSRRTVEIGISEADPLV